MTKQPHKMGKHVVGLEQGNAPLEVVEQAKQLKTILGDETTELSRTTRQVENMTQTRSIIKAKLECTTPNFELELPAYDVDIQDRCINLQVPPEFSLSSNAKMEFDLTVNGMVYPVIFLGLTVHFKETNCHAIMFLKK